MDLYKKGKLFLKNNLNKDILAMLKAFHSFLNGLRYKPYHEVIGILYRLSLNPVNYNSKFKIFYPFNIPNSMIGELYLDEYEKSERILANKYISPNDSVLELGGSLGVVACSINSILSNKKNHIVLEPNKFIIKYLEKNKVKNNFQFKIEDKVLSDESKISFYCDNNFLISTVKKKPNTTIQGIKINDLEKKYNLKFNFLVMDVEGSEVEVLNHLVNNKNTINKIIMETHFTHGFISEEDRVEMNSNLSRLGFRLIEKIENVEYWEK